MCETRYLRVAKVQSKITIRDAKKNCQTKHARARERKKAIAVGGRNVELMYRLQTGVVPIVHDGTLEYGAYAADSHLSKRELANLSFM